MKVIKPTTLTKPDGSYSRNSSGTYIDNLGLIKTVGNNVPRFEYDFTNGRPNGILIESAAQNLFQYTEDISNSYWSKTNSNVFTNFAYAPDGNNTADLLRENNSTGFHEITVDHPVISGNTYVHSFFVKASGVNILGLTETGSVWGSTSIVYFDLTNGSVNGDVNFYTIEKLGGGWYRISKKNTANSNGIGTFKLLLAKGTLTSPIVSYTGDNTSGVLIWGCQLELNNKSSYIANTGSSLNTRAEDVIAGNGIIYSSATETVPVWNSGTSYLLSAKVRYAGKIWESLQTSNLNNIPDAENSSWWIEFGPDNKNAMFDRQVSTATSATTVLNVVVKPGLIDSVALINVQADYVYVTVRDSSDVSGNVIARFDAGLSGVLVSDWYDYFFSDPLIKRSQIVFSEIPPFVDCVVSLEFFVAENKPVSVSSAVFGSLTDLGLSQFGASAGIIDYSIKNTDDFGTITFVERPYSKRLNAQVMMMNSRLNRNFNLLTNLRATPCVWIISDNSIYEEAGVIYGFYKDFSIDLAYPSHSICSIEIEGLT